MGLLILLAVALAALVLCAAAALAYVLTHPPRRTEGYALAHGLPTDPADAGAAFEVHRIAASDGRPIELWVVDGAAADGPAIVMLHGWADGRLGELLWLEAVRPVASKLVLYDQRGHGDSPHRRCTWGPAEAADALAIARWLADPPDSGRIVLMGCSMGAVVAMCAAAEGRGLIHAVVADSPYRHAADVVRRTLRQQRLPPRPLLDLALVWHGLRRLSGLKVDTAELASRLTQPLLVIHGEEDTAVPTADARAIAEAAPLGRLRPFPDTGHLQAACTHQARYTEALRAFLAEIDAVKS